MFVSGGQRNSKGVFFFRNMLSFDTEKNKLLEFHHSKYNLCMVREIHYNSLTDSCSLLCLYSKWLSINKPDGLDTDMFSVSTFITTWLGNHDLSFPFTPFSCYHHPSYQLLQYSKMPALTSECHFIQQPSKSNSEAIQKTSLPFPNGSTGTLELANTTSNRAPQNNCWLYPKAKDRTKNIRLPHFWILNKWFFWRKL